MDMHPGEQTELRRESHAGKVRRRHVIFVEGFDPSGPDGFYSLFQRACDRFRREWPICLTLGPLELDSDDFAHWLVRMQAASWQVTTRYEFLRLERFIRFDLAAPIGRHLMRTLGWIVDDLMSGAQFRIFRASWRFGLHLVYFQLLPLACLALPAMAGLIAALMLVDRLNFPVPVALLVPALAVLASFRLLRPMTDRWFGFRVNSCWVVMRAFARGQATWLDRAVDVCARRVVAIARANEADEFVVIGHSFGGAIASAVMARALQLDPDLGRRGPRLVLLTLGSIVPGVALHPAAERMRAVLGRLAVEPTLAWIDCRSRKDALCFSDFDPVGDVGIHIDAPSCNPLIWPVRLEEMVSPEDYRRIKWNLLRLHYQYMMAATRPASYDYILLVGGPFAIAEWTKRHSDFALDFDQDEILGGGRGSCKEVGITDPVAPRLHQPRSPVEH